MSSASSSLLVVLELANNHLGSVERAKRIIDEHGAVCNRRGIRPGFKLQLRDIDSLIHPDFAAADIKHIKRFRSTRMSHEQFAEIVAHIKSSGFLTVATPFDEPSVMLLDELDIDVAKVGSCSADDWPLLEEIAKLNRMVIISTAGASKETVQRAAAMMRDNGRDFALMHCVGEYPTPPEHANLNRIDELRSWCSRVRVGISTHERPSSRSIVPYAIAKGCTIIEKHVDIDDGMNIPNAYSCLPRDIDLMFDEIALVASMLSGHAPTEASSLRELKRGVYAAAEIHAGDKMRREDFMLAMPCQEGQLDASGLYDVLGSTAAQDVSPGQPLPAVMRDTIRDERTAAGFVERAARLLDRAGIAYTSGDPVELSAHYGLGKFEQTGALIIDRVNREYCKKLIVMFPGQQHPAHHHVQKEEAFELLYGDCTLVVAGVRHIMKRGHAILIDRRAVHSFSSTDRCVIEEISTTHVQGDSIYDDPAIFKLRLDERKVMSKFKRSSPR